MKFSKNIFFGIAAANTILDGFEVRLQYGNSGRVFFAPEYGPEIFGDFGTTCSGTGRDAITGENGEKFAHLVCKTLGFKTKDAKIYLGLKAYNEALKLKIDEDLTCLPDYIVSGFNPAGKTFQGRPDRLRNYQIEGGTCLQGHSDVFVHCPADKKNEGIWSEWSEWNFPSHGAMFKQRKRTCKKTGRSAAPSFCEGTGWLEVAPHGPCLGDIDNSDYNAGYDYSAFYDYSDYYEPVNTDKRRRREPEKLFSLGPRGKTPKKLRAKVGENYLNAKELYSNNKYLGFK